MGRCSMVGLGSNSVKIGKVRREHVGSCSGMVGLGWFAVSVWADAAASRWEVLAFTILYNGLDGSGSKC